MFRFKHQRLFFIIYDVSGTKYYELCEYDEIFNWWLNLSWYAKITVRETLRQAFEYEEER